MGKVPCHTSVRTGVQTPEAKEKPDTVARGYVIPVRSNQETGSGGRRISKSCLNKVHGED